MTGKVWLTGAGPSDIELLTVKAKKVLEQAEVVVYDSLVGTAILALIPEDAEKIDVGKRAGNHKMTQDNISQLLVDLAQQGKRVVRLKGGDPFLFGRGGEEAELLFANNIPYEVIPGVTSAISVPAYAGIPVTHRDAASMIHIITGHKKKDEELDINFDALTKAGGTLIFMMSISAIGDISEGLMKAGMDPNTPTAIVSCGATARQEKVRANLKDLKELIRTREIKTPGILIVGEVCAYDEQLEWRQHLKLDGDCYYLTRPRERSTKMAELLREYGAEVVELPCIQTKPILPNNRLLTEVQDIKNYDLIVFTSPAGVLYFFEFLKTEQIDIRNLMHLKYAVIGSGTKNELLNYGIYADHMPNKYDGAELGKLIGEMIHSGNRVLIPRASEGNPLIIEEIRKRSDAFVADIPLYTTLPISSGAIDVAEQIALNRLTKAVFTSASTVRGFLAQARNADVSKIQAFCIGEMTAAEARKAGMQCLVSEEASIEALVELILNEHAGGKYGSNC
ncbi:MAG: uroporphyrinogen-III C-methyltransferase [Lachnospiraceae bacterium]